mgnify:CR=1 FL=1
MTHALIISCECLEVSECGEEDEGIVFATFDKSFQEDLRSRMDVRVSVRISIC